MGYIGNEPADVAVQVGSDVITSTEIQDASIATADIANDAITANKVDDDGTGFQMGSLGLGTAVSGSEKLTVGGTASFSGAITGTLATAAQTNITSVGTLTGLTVAHNNITLQGTGETQLLINAASGNNPGIRFQENSANKWTIGNDQSDDSLFFYDFGGSAKRFSIDSAGDVSLLTAGKRYYIPRASDGALTGSLYSSTGNTITLSGAGSSSGQINFIPSASNSSAVALTLDSSQNATFSGNITQSADANLRHTITAGGSGEASLVLTANNSTGDSFVRWETNANTFCMGLDNSDSNKFILSCGSDPHSNSVINIQPDGSSIAVDKPISFGGVVQLLDVAQSIDFIQSGAINIDSNNDQTGRVLTIGTNRTGDSGGTTIATFTDTGNYGIGVNPSKTFHVAQGKPVRIPGNWEVVDVLSAKDNQSSYLQSDNCFNDNIYSQFKIVIPYINADTANATLLFTYMYNSGSGLTEQTGDYYTSMDISPHTSSSYSGGTQTNATRAQIFGAMHGNVAVGVSGEMKIYEAFIADLRAYNQFTANTMRSGDGNIDGDRGSNYRPIIDANLLGYNTDYSAYVSQRSIVRMNTDRHASYWKGFRIQASTGNLGAKSQIIVMGRAL